MTQNLTINPSIIGYKTHPSLSERADCSALSLKEGPQLTTPGVTSLFRDAADPVKFFICLKTEEQQKLFKDDSLDSKDRSSLLKSLSDDTKFLSLAESLAADIRNPLLDNLYTNDELKEISPPRQVAVFHATADISKKLLILSNLPSQPLNHIFTTLNSDTKKEFLGALKIDSLDDVRKLAQLFNKLNLASRRDLASYLTVENLTHLLNEINLNTNVEFINLLSTSTFSNVFPNLHENKQVILLTLYATDHRNQLDPQFLANSLSILPKDTQYSLFNTYNAGEAKQVQLFELISDVNTKKSLIEELYASTLPKFLSHLNANQIKNVMALYSQDSAGANKQGILRTMSSLLGIYQSPNSAITILNNIPSPETKKFVFNSLSAEHLTSIINKLAAKEMKPLLALAIDAAKQAQIFNLITSDTVKKELFASLDKETQIHLLAQLNPPLIKGLFDLFIDDSTMQTNILSNLPNAVIRAEFFKTLPEASQKQFAKTIFHENSLAYKFLVQKTSPAMIEGAKQFVNKVSSNWFSSVSFNLTSTLSILEGNPLLRNHTCTQQKISSGNCFTTNLDKVTVQHILPQNIYKITLSDAGATLSFPKDITTGFSETEANTFLKENLPYVNGKPIDTKNLQAIATNQPGVEYTKRYEATTDATSKIRALLEPQSTIFASINNVAYRLSVTCSEAFKQFTAVTQCVFEVNSSVKNAPDNANPTYGVSFVNNNETKTIEASHAFISENWDNVIKTINQTINNGYQPKANDSLVTHYGKPVPASYVPGFFDSLSFELPSLGQMANSTLSKALPALLGIYTAVKCGKFAAKAIYYKDKSLGQKMAAVFTAAAVGLAGLGLAVNRINAMS